MFRMDQDGTALDVFHGALSQFPRLRHIRLTDFHELTHESKTYVHLCNRLFGNSLQSRGLHRPWDTWNEFLQLISYMTGSPADIQSFSIGGHPYESLPDLWRVGGPNRTPILYSFDLPAMPYHQKKDWLEDFDDDYEIEKVCSRLKHLRLAITFENESNDKRSRGVENKMKDDSVVAQMLRNCTPSLVRLSLLAVDLIGFEDRMITYDRTGSEWLDHIVFPYEFTSLQHIEPSGWPISDNKNFQTFLLKHSSTLREVCLDNCMVLGRAVDLSRWAGQNMFFSGVHMNLISQADCEPEKPHWTNESLEALWLDGRPNSLQKKQTVQCTFTLPSRRYDSDSSSLLGDSASVPGSPESDRSTVHETD